MTYVTVSANIDVDMDEIDTADLVDELRKRDIRLPSMDHVEELKVIYHKRRQGLDYQRELDQFMYNVLGVTV